MKCCICGKKFVGWGNNPWGALDEDGKVIDFDEYERCCNECNMIHVLPGRIQLYQITNGKRLVK